MTETIKIIGISAISGIVSGLIICLCLIFLMNAVMSGVMQNLATVNVDCSEEFAPGYQTIKIGEALFYCRLTQETVQDENRLKVNPGQGGIT